MSRFRTIITISFLGIIASLFIAPPSNAFFGIGDCSNVKHKILAEEQVGRSLWKTYNSYVLANEKTTKNTYTYSIALAISDVYDSDIRVYNLALKSTKCFNANQTAYIRSSKSQTLAMQNIMKDKISQSARDSSFTWNHISWKAIYPTYYSLYSEIKNLK